ncbi:MAG: type II secretion system protein GspK [Planctomycetota bacterium]|nr:type II secretion system protein GspK [Planctomycetota bacterium]
MKLLQPNRLRAAVERRGAALMLAFLVLSVLLLIVFQIAIGTSTDARVARNDQQLTLMDAAIRSALLRTMEDLAEDAAAAAEEGGDPSVPAAPSPFGGIGGDDPAAQPTGPTDSKEDAWAKPQQTEINGISLRVMIQDEDSKYNVLSMLTEDDEEAEKAFDRVVRILDMCRQDTGGDIDEGDARDMAEAMRDFMLDRSDMELPRPVLLTDRNDLPERGLPTTLREFVVLAPFNEHHFRDYRDSEGVIVHSIGSFLTVSTSVSSYQDYLDALEEEGAENATTEDTGPEPRTDGATSEDGSSATDAGGEVPDISETDIESTGTFAGGDFGVAVNVNTAPSAVLHGISDRRDISWTFLDEIITYRNEEEESDDEDAEPIYDEFGEEVITRQVFESLEELEDVYGWEMLEPDARDDFMRFLSVESSVFTIFVTARKAISEDGDTSGFGLTAAERREQDERGTDLLRTVKCVVWRYEDGDEWKVVPLEPWEVLDYQPFEVLDVPDDER